ncbi:MAG: hypothetical protein QXW10_03225 [Candidatus Micrarchaeaceae archaeon]
MRADKSEKGAPVSKKSPAIDGDDAKGAKKRGSPYSRSLLYIIAVLIAVDLLLFFYHSGAAQPFYNFEGSFQAAPSVSIYITADNSTALQATVGCATQLIESIVSSSQHHRNASSINFFVLNQSACFSSASALGAASNATQKPIGECLNISKSMPSIFINYSANNITTIEGSKLIMQGNAKFLKECGIAPALS